MRPVDERVAELLERIRAGTLPADARTPNELNEDRVEEFLREVEAGLGASRVRILRQPIPWHARRTTRMNYAVEVPGRKPDALVLVAHYDTWGGPGADDNTTGEEILKQYLRDDLARPAPPEFTRVYLFAGSEECGLIGFLSQLLLAGFFWAVSFAVTEGDYLAAAIALVLGPLLTYRFGVAGSRHYVKSLPKADLERIRAVVSVDSVGEGKLYFPVTTLGANFLRAVLPFRGSDRLDDLLRETAHVHGIRYNTYLAGGTTDHLSFLEVNRSLPRVLWDLLRRLGCALARREYVPPFTIPASAIVAMCPGKASAFILGGKIHTKKDTADRIYPQPLRETLLVLDGFFRRLEEGVRPEAPRVAEDAHYARLYRLSDGRAVLALKDAVEPNRRNVNLLCGGRLEDGRFEVESILEWGTEENLDREVGEYAAPLGLSWRLIPAERLEVRQGRSTLNFAARPGGLLRSLPWRLLGTLEHLLGTFSFGAMFGSALALGHAMNFGLERLSLWHPAAQFIADHVLVVSTGWMLLQIAILAWLFIRAFPTWIDDAYKHLNRADNGRSLRRT
jgi:hypothetical protein